MSADRIDPSRTRRDPEVRQTMDEAAHSDDAGVLRCLNDWAQYSIGDTFSQENRSLEGRQVGDIAAERDQRPFDTLDTDTATLPAATQEHQ